MTDLTQRIQRNFVWKFLGDGSRGLLAVFLLLVARHYGPADFGVFALLYAATIFFSIVADLGLNLLTTRQIAAHKAHLEENAAYLRTFFTCKLILLPAWIIVPLLLYKYSSYHNTPLDFVLLFAAALSMRNLMEFFGAIFTGFELIQFEAVIKFSANILMLGFGLAFMAYGLPISSMALAMFVGYFSAAVAGCVWCQAKWRLFPLAFHPQGLSCFYREALPLLLLGACMATLTKWNTVVMGLMGIEAVQIGWFGASEKLIAAFEALPLLVTAASYPVLADLHHNDSANFFAARNRLLKIFISVGALAAVVISLTSKPLIHLLYGDAYAQAWAPLCILAMGLVAAFPNVMLINILVASKRSWKGAWATILACLANFVLTLWLIPLWGMPGSAAASTIAQVVLFACALFFVIKIRPGPQTSRES